MIKNYGLLISEEKDARAYGAGTLPKVVLKEDGQWDEFLPVYEPQFNEFYDSFGCVVWATQNVIEIMLKKIKGIEYNFSERFTYILGKVTPPGSDPHHIAEVVRNNGLIDNELLPMTKTFAEFLKPNPMTSELKDKGMEFPYEVNHEYLWQDKITKEVRTKLMKEYLCYSPLGVAVTAWHEENGVYVDLGKRNTHFTVCHGWNTKGWKVFDTYDHSLKIVSFDHNMEVCKRYYLEPSTRLPQISLIERILNLMKSLLFIWPKEKPIEPLPEPEPPPEPSNLKHILWGRGIEAFENMDKSFNNPGAIKGTNGKFLKFASYEEGWSYLLRYLERAATGQHKAYKPEFTLLKFFQVYAPSNDNNNPTNYARFVSKRIGVDTSEQIKNLV